MMGPEEVMPNLTIGLFTDPEGHVIGVMNGDSALRWTATPILWTLIVFFGATVAFGAIRNATEDQSAGVTIGLQAVAMVLIIAVVVAVVPLPGAQVG